MRNPYEIYDVRETLYADILGHEALVTEWSDHTWTACISRKEYGVEIVIMDGDVEWDYLPSEDDLSERIEEILEDMFDEAHP